MLDEWIKVPSGDWGPRMILNRSLTPSYFKGNLASRSQQYWRAYYTQLPTPTPYPLCLSEYSRVQPKPESKVCRHRLLSTSLQGKYGETIYPEAIEGEMSFFALSPMIIFCNRILCLFFWRFTECDGLYMLGTIRRCGPVGLGVSLWAWALRPSS